MKISSWALSLLFAATAATVLAAPPAKTISLDPSLLGKAPTSSWPTFNGDYTGQRYSTLTQIAPPTSINSRSNGSSRSRA